MVLCPFSNDPIQVSTPADKIKIRKEESSRFLKNTDYADDTNLISKLSVQAHFLSLYGPYQDIESQEHYYCDPLHLNYFGRHCVKDFSRESIRSARQY